MLHFTNLVLVFKTLRRGAPRAGFFFCSVERRLGHDPRVLGCNPSCAHNLHDLEKMKVLPWVLVFLYAESQDTDIDPPFCDGGQGKKKRWNVSWKDTGSK